jgi:hypothetical protein
MTNPLENVYWCLECGDPTTNEDMDCGMCEQEQEEHGTN